MSITHDIENALVRCGLAYEDGNLDTVETPFTSDENDPLRALSTDKYEDEWANAGNEWHLFKRHIGLGFQY
ncbi:hypothetical protein [Rhodococcus sp. NPDC049939]|uniref:hypothetical protein n=1 Tax=Rhodococcus sp. NPDC049939 TaxID=3155511 RepID=UPI0033DE263B